MTTHVLYYMEKRRNKNVFELSRVIRCSYKRLNTVFVVRAWFVLLLFYFSCAAAASFFLFLLLVVYAHFILFYFCSVLFLPCAHSMCLCMCMQFTFYRYQRCIRAGYIFRCSISLTLKLSLCVHRLDFDTSLACSCRFSTCKSRAQIARKFLQYNVEKRRRKKISNPTTRATHV